MNRECTICSKVHGSVRNDRVGARHRRYEHTRDNGGVAPVEVHNKSTYNNWGCRCGECLASMRVERGDRVSRQETRDLIAQVNAQHDRTMLSDDVVVMLQNLYAETRITKRHLSSAEYARRNEAMREFERRLTDFRHLGVSIDALMRVLNVSRTTIINHTPEYVKPWSS